MQQLKLTFFETEYHGNAHVNFADYLWRCWKVYDSKIFRALYVTVVQSSGFGKSRMLFELARRAKAPSSQMKVLYTCARLHESTGYPEATTNLRNWLIPESSTVEQITSRLEAIYNYAVNNWEEVQGEWIKLFNEKKSDVIVRRKLDQQAENDKKVRKAGKIVRGSVKKNQDGKMVVLVVDEARSLLNEKADPGALTVKVNDFRLLRRALALVNNRIGAEGGIFGVFVDTSPKISDSESEVRPSFASDPSSRNYTNSTGDATFPPFVLTHTMDTHWREYYLKLNESNQREGRKSDDDDMTGGGQVETLSEEAELKAEIAAYKAIVTGSENDAWNALLRMGRPMWWSTFTDRDGLSQASFGDLVTEAANKLLLGNDFKQEASYNEKTMFGVASMLCRLGVRPYSTSTLASQVVADFMAVLAYVKFESEGYLSSYASDPVLALGAISVWHFLEDGLSKYILPQLKKLILDEALETGGIGEMVARIVLLLAMDQCVMGDRSKSQGQFVSVESFLNVMGCDEIEVYIEGMLPGNKEKLNEWKSEWKDWRMGFTHFIQLQAEPNEDTLWYLLGRRAAGIFPRNQLGADLMIPVFWNKDGEKERVSFMLIQVKSRFPKDDGFSQAASKKLSPGFVSESPHPKGKKPKEGPAAKKPVVKPALQKRTVNENPLSETPVSDVIRICMNLSKEETSGPESLNDSFRFISSTSLTKDSSTPEARGEDTDVYTLCFRSLGCETYHFLKEDVAQCLASIVASQWDPMALVDGDLERRRVIDKGTKTNTLQGALTTAIPDHELRQTARRGLACTPGHDVKYQDEKSKKKGSCSGDSSYPMSSLDVTMGALKASPKAHHSWIPTRWSHFMNDFIFTFLLQEKDVIKKRKISQQTLEKKDATDASDFTQYATPKELQEKKNIACALLRGVIIRAYSIVNDVANSVAVVPAPCVTVVQSSVFGKSQILFELARKAGDEGSKMKVLYICARVHESTGDPEGAQMSSLDVPMENTESGLKSPPQLNPDVVAAFMNNFIYTFLSEKGVISKLQAGEEVLVVAYPRDFAKFATPKELQKNKVIVFVGIAAAAVNAWIDEFGEKDLDSPPVLSDELMQQLKLTFFETEYHGNAHGAQMSSLDVPMENTESGLKSPPQLNPDVVAAFMNNFIYTFLSEKGVISKLQAGEEVLVVAYPRDFAKFATPKELQKNKVIVFVGIAAAAVNAWIDEFGEKDLDSPPVLSDELMQQLKLTFFETEYHGNAHVNFADYLWRCWKVYDSKIFRALYVTVVQSSGFGKSRMLFELARRAKAPSSQMKVLYTCARLHESTGYPEATTNLRNWLIPESSTVEQITSRLEAIYNYAVKNWEEVQGEWIKLFNEKKSDVIARRKLDQQAENDKKVRKAGKIVRGSVKKNQDGKMVVLVVDEARSLLNQKADPGALTLKVNDFRLLRRALALVNNRIGAEGGIFGVFVDTSPKISDSESEVRPSFASDPSSRNYTNSTGDATFPPFVLTHTMDTHWREYYLKLNESNQREGRKSDDDDMTGGGQVETLSEEAELKAEIAAYKAIVTGSENDAWNALLRMGRPMWWSTFTDRDGLSQASSGVLVTEAANKLLLGNDFKQEASYNEKTMFGAASMLCRLGVRPYSTSTLASQVVADFMAVLAYVKFESEGYLSSYASDPVLALGAISVWHFLEDGLSKYILPQLKKLILDEALETGGIGEMVARIVLLLAMDQCVMGDRSKSHGQFVSVESFLNVMGCDEIEVYIEGMLPGNKEKFNEWKSEWKDWRMGFTHFIQLQAEPNEDTLWYLLGRRAAGIFPRNQLGADLMIPVFWNKDGEKERVSFMLIQVKSRFPKDDGFSQAASKKLSPGFVSESPHPKGKKPKEGPAAKKPVVKPALKKRTVNENPLSETPVSDVIRICMNLSKEETSGPESLNDSFRFIFSTSLTKDSSTPEVRGEDTDVYTLCFRSLGCETYPFLKEDVAQCIASIVASQWDPMALVDGNLERRRVIDKGTKTKTLQEALTTAIPDHELRQTARRGLACTPGHDVKYQDEKSKKKEVAREVRKVLLNVPNSEGDYFLVPRA
ncbi:hypothetical protein PInf_011573 [Phytophthora infestans]|nr:hypothetical protein PInf_011573 [Phytophthora infestans]